MSYTDKLKDPRWQKKRLKIFDRDNWKCRGCGRDNMELHVHHLRYTSALPWEENENNLSTLCRYCHDSLTALAMILDKFNIDCSASEVDSFVKWFTRIKIETEKTNG